MKIDNKKILTPIKFNPDFKLKLMMLADHNKRTNQTPASVAALVRYALYKTFPVLNSDLIKFGETVCSETKKFFADKLEAF